MPIQGKTGRPKADETANILNPRFRKVRVAALIYDYIYLATGYLLDGKDRLIVEAELREWLLSLFPVAPASFQKALSISDIGIHPSMFQKNVENLTFPEINQLKHDPQRITGQLTGSVLGFGKYWFRDLVRSVPPNWVVKRRRFFTLKEFKNQRKKHAGNFDCFTSRERCFYKLPPEAQLVIERTVRKCDVEGSESNKYLHASFDFRNNPKNLPPKELTDEVMRAMVMYQILCQ